MLSRTDPEGHMGQMSQEKERHARQREEYMQRSRGRKEYVNLEKLSQAAVVGPWCPMSLGRPLAPGQVTQKAMLEVKTLSWGQWEPQKVHSTGRT